MLAVTSLDPSLYVGVVHWPETKIALKMQFDGKEGLDCSRMYI